MSQYNFVKGQRVRVDFGPEDFITGTVYEVHKEEGRVSVLVIEDKTEDMYSVAFPIVTPLPL